MFHSLRDESKRTRKWAWETKTDVFRGDNPPHDRMSSRGIKIDRRPQLAELWVEQKPPARSMTIRVSRGGRKVTESAPIVMIVFEGNIEEGRHTVT